MGKVVKTLSDSTISTGMFFNSVRIESAECIHIHWRNARLILNKKQFQTLNKCVTESYQKYEKSNFAEGEGNGIVLKELKISPSDELLVKMTCELNENNSVHIHYKDFRIELSKEDFLQFAQNIAEARNQFKK